MFRRNNMWKWYRDGIKFLHTFDIDSVCLGSFLLGIMVGALNSPVASVNPLIYFVLGVGFLSAPTYKFIKRKRLSFAPEVIVKTIIKECLLKRSQQLRMLRQAQQPKQRKLLKKDLLLKKLLKNRG